MKKTIKQKPHEEQSIDILKRIAKRVEEATIDIHSMKSDLKFVDIRLSNVEHNTKMMKVDMEELRADIATMKKDIKEIKRDTNGLITTTAHILKKGVTLDEHSALYQRVSALEQS